MKKLVLTLILFLTSCESYNSPPQMTMLDRQSVPLINFTLLSKVGSSSVDKYGGEQALLTSILLRSSLIPVLENNGISVYSIDNTLDSFSISFSVLKERFNDVSKLFFEELKKLKISQENLDSAKKELISSLHKRSANPAISSYLEYLEILFQKHPYAKINLKEDQITKITLDDIQKVYQATLNRNDNHMILVGDIKGIDKKMLASYLNLLPVSKTSFPQTPKENDSINPQNTLHNLYKNGLTQSFVNIGFKTPSYNEEDSYIYLLLREIIGGGFSSRLFKELREKRGLTYSPSLTYRPYLQMGSFTIRYSTKNSSIDESIIIVNHILADIKENGVTANELDIAKKMISSSIQDIEESNENLAQTISNAIIRKTDPFYYKELKDKVNTITLTDFNKKSKKILKEAQVTTLILRAK